jgi:glycosyltransferase involved in cell wall biosynthesis
MPIIAAKVNSLRDVLIISHFAAAPGAGANSRFHYLAGAVSAHNDCRVELVISDFSHRAKRPLQLEESVLRTLPYGLTPLHEKGYRKNISIGRLISHRGFGSSLKAYLKERDKPDVIYCAVPSLDAAYAAALFAQSRRIPMILDIQDLWPEAFLMKFDIKPFSSLLFAPMKKKADFIYAAADAIVAVSQTYVDRALAAGGKCRAGYSVFLGTDLEEFDRLAAENAVSKPDGEFRLGYIGTLGHSYDIPCVLDAVKQLHAEGRVKNLKLIVMGDGPLRTSFERYAGQLSVPAEFTGRLDYGKMAGLLASCDAAVNPIVRGSAASIINKVGDYAAAGLPVLNTQESEEYRGLVDSYRCGFNCNNSDPADLAEKLALLLADADLCAEMGRNNRRLAEEKFDRKRTYRVPVDLMRSFGGPGGDDYGAPDRQPAGAAD